MAMPALSGGRKGKRQTDVKFCKWNCQLTVKAKEHRAGLTCSRVPKASVTSKPGLSNSAIAHEEDTPCSPRQYLQNAVTAKRYPIPTEATCFKDLKISQTVLMKMHVVSQMRKYRTNKVNSHWTSCRFSQAKCSILSKKKWISYTHEHTHIQLFQKLGPISE